MARRRRVHGKIDGEGRTLAGLAFHGDIAAHHAAKPAADGQAESGAAEFSRRRGIHLREIGEQLIDFERGYADAGIDDTVPHPIDAVPGATT